MRSCYNCIPLWCIVAKTAVIYDWLACPGEDLHNLGPVCDLEVPATPRMMPPPTANPTMLEVICIHMVQGPSHICKVSGYLCILCKKYLAPISSCWTAVQAVLRMEGANLIPFTANNLNIFVSAVVAQLPNVTARDIVISQVGASAAGAALLTHAWPLRVCIVVRGRCVKAASSSCKTAQGLHMDPPGADCTRRLPERECWPVLWPSAGHSSSVASARLGLGAASAQADWQRGSGARVCS